MILLNSSDSVLKFELRIEQHSHDIVITLTICLKIMIKYQLTPKIIWIPHHLLD